MPDSSTHYEVQSNGLTILLRETHLAPVVNLQIWAKVGSADERPGEEGLAHFHEHMLFKGTERRGVGDVAGDVEGAGGRVNAYTSFDTTVYYATLPSSATATGIDVLIDAIRNSIFDPDEVQRETEVVLEEIRRANDSPGHVLGNAVFSELYRAHPYRRPILGPAENVASFDRHKVMDFFHRWYTPENLVVVGAGDFDAPAIAAEIAAAFADAKRGTAVRARPIEPTQSALRSTVLRRDFERVQVDLSWPTTTFRNADSTHLELLSFILGECDSSRLVQRVKERDGLADRIDSSSYTPLDRGLFAVNIEVDARRAHDAIEATIREVERLRNEPVSSDEIERARANFLCTEHFERESVSGLAGKLGSFHVLGGDWRSEETYFEMLRNATPHDLLRVARAYLAPEQLTVGALLPESEDVPMDHASLLAAVGNGTEQTRRAFAPPTRLSDGDTSEDSRASNGASNRASKRAVSSSPSGTAREIYSYALSGGGTLHVAPRRQVPVVAARAAFHGGLLSESADRAGLTNFMTAMWMRGTVARSTADFARAVENLAAEIEGFSGRSSLGATLEVTSDKLLPSLDLFAEVLLEPAFADEELERERRDTLAAIDRREDRLAQQAYLLFTETLYREHPYRLPMIGHRESVERFDADLLRAHHTRLLHAGQMVMAVSGDVDPDEVAEAVSVRLSALPSGEVAPLWDREEDAPTEIRRAVLEKDREQAHLVIGFRGLTVRDPDRHALEVISQLLAGQGGRLFLELRDRRSLAYSVSAVNMEGMAPGFFTVYIGTAPEKVDEARRGILAELERLVVEPPTDDELARAKRYITGNFAIDLQRNAAHAARMALDGLYGLGPDSDLHYIEQIESITKEDVLRVARRVLVLDAYVEALVRP